MSEDNDNNEEANVEEYLANVRSVYEWLIQSLQHNNIPPSMAGSACANVIGQIASSDLTEGVINTEHAMSMMIVPILMTTHQSKDDRLRRLCIAMLKGLEQEDKTLYEQLQASLKVSTTDGFAETKQ